MMAPSLFPTGELRAGERGAAGWPAGGVRRDPVPGSDAVGAAELGRQGPAAALPPGPPAAQDGGALHPGAAALEQLLQEEENLGTEIERGGRERISVRR